MMVALQLAPISDGFMYRTCVYTAKVKVLKSEARMSLICSCYASVPEVIHFLVIQPVL